MRPLFAVVLFGASKTPTSESLPTLMSEFSVAKIAFWPLALIVLSEMLAREDRSTLTPFLALSLIVFAAIRTEDESVTLIP